MTGLSQLPNIEEKRITTIMKLICNSLDLTPISKSKQFYLKEMMEG